LLFDQFEELISQFEEAPPGDDLRAALEVQNNILQILAELMRDPALRVKLLFVFREDDLAKLGKLFVLYPNLPDTYLRLTPLRTESLHDIICGPFDRFPGHFQPELSSALADRLETAFRERSKSGFLNLSETQIACLQLWQAKDPEETFASRGVQGLHEDYLSEALNRMPGVLQDLTVALLSSVVTDSGLRNVISREDLVGRVKEKEEDRIPEERSEAALKALEEEKTRLIRREHRHDAVFHEIISEFLVPWIARQKAERKEKQRQGPAAQMDGRGGRPSARRSRDSGRGLVGRQVPDQGGGNYRASETGGGFRGEGSGLRKGGHRTGKSEFPETISVH